MTATKGALWIVTYSLAPEVGSRPGYSHKGTDSQPGTLCGIV